MSVFSFLVLNFSFLPGCGNGDGKSVVVVYSPHGQYLEGDIKTRFEAAHPEYRVEFLDMGGGDIFPRIQAEKERPGADVWWGGSPGDFIRAEELGLLEPYTPDWTKSLPADAKSSTGGWAATFRTPELIMYNKDKLKPEDVPQTWDELVEPKWKGRIVIRDVRASSTMKTIFGALILRQERRTGKVDDGFDFLKKLDANTGAYAANPQMLYDFLQRDGPYAVTLWNLADALLLKSQGKPFEYVIPKDTVVPVEPIAIVKGGKNSAGAKLFFDFVNSPEQLILMAKERHRLPARTDLPQDQLPQWMRDMKLDAMQIDWATFQKNTEKWIARWDAEIKGRYKQD